MNIICDGINIRSEKEQVQDLKSGDYAIFFGDFANADLCYCSTRVINFFSSTGRK